MSVFFNIETCLIRLFFLILSKQAQRLHIARLPDRKQTTE
ncbi:hypothetical protein HMPREF1870_00446 [Bacteroidales bacterium KA00344]|nr:hypothetical protein HMPREF1870_00446 [Bacteroidales bacterium KA00344]